MYCPIIFATTAALKQPIIIFLVTFLWTSSIENKTPARGAPNAIERPALAPDVIKYFSSTLFLRNILDTSLPLMAPSWIDGPSRPSDNPPRLATKPPVIL